MSAQHPGPGGPPPAADAAVVGVLGVIAIRRDGSLRPLPGARARLLLTALAVRPGRARSAQALVEEVWGEQPPRAPMNALHTQVSRLRALLPEGALEIGPAGYRLTLPEDDVDLTAAQALARRADKRLAAGELADCLSALTRARALWRGEPGADLPDSAPADDLRAAADHLRRDLDRIELAARTVQGDLPAALTLARAAVDAQPLDEPAHTTLIRLLAAADRTADALEVFATYRLRLIEELGADPGPALLALNTSILRGDPIPLPGLATGTHPNRSAPSAPTRRPSEKTVDPGTTAPVETGWSSGAAGDHRGADSSGTSAGRMVDDPSGQAEIGDLRPGAARSDGRADSALPTALGLRAAPNELLGRADDLDAIAAMVEQSRVTTILGPGGTGKTRVANAVGARLGRTMPVVLVELASVQGESSSGAEARVDIEAAIGYVMGLGELSDSAQLRAGRAVDAGRRLREALDARPTLLILDNCEHVIEAAADLVSDLVGVCAGLTVLTTSRSPLAITAETVYPLAPLAIDAAGSPATDLFRARARAVRPEVRLDPETVARLCRTLDGLPLAIELAAARVRTMSVAEIETRLEHRFALLRSGDRAAPHRHRTLHAVIAWSWNLLEPDQQVVLRRLSRFPAGFTLSAAEAVAAGAEVLDVAMAVDGLVGQSLLTVLDDPDDGSIRYRMLETVREFGAEQLAAIDAETDGAESALVRDRMGRWAREFAAAAIRTYRAGDQVAAVLAVGAELDNLVVVLRTATDRGDASTVYGVFPVVATLWMMRGAHLEFTGWALRVVAVTPPEPTTGDAADLQMVTHVLSLMHLMFLNGGDTRPVMTVRLRARRLLTHPGLDPGLWFLGRLISVPLGDYRVGRLFADSVRSPQPQVRVAALIGRANFWENLGNMRGSTRDALRALDELGPGEVWGAANICQHLAQLCGQSARYDEAVRYYRRSLALMDRLRIHDEIMESRCYLAAALIGSGRRAEARAELDFALRPSDSGIRQIDDPGIRRNHRIATVATAVAELELADGDIDAGLGHFRRALDLLGWPEFDVTPGPGGLMVASGALSAYVLQGRADEAADLVDSIVTATSQRLTKYFDLPQIGAVGCALGSYLLATDTDRAAGLELLALAATSVARQDNPSMELARHLDLHRATVGAEAIERAVQRAGAVRRTAAAHRIVEIVGTLA
ncbi:BTAD domain-containing putative transcriptional regulator [Nocardia sp. AG03]|uniref:AfsR/SARP family transcriptional regulator n=1 Tax=Nocardia sp. AG03 TaxID=3025312 RepID=UPI00241882F1|nr:BTAD domain-containing putative transcriptional regulator [Nocardia sp. AG03]